MRARTWTVEEKQELTYLYGHGAPVPQIAEKLDRTEKAIKRALYDIGVKVARSVERERFESSPQILPKETPPEPVDLRGEAAAKSKSAASCYWHLKDLIKYHGAENLGVWKAKDDFSPDAMRNTIRLTQQRHSGASCALADL